MLILLQELMHRTYVEINGEAPKRNEIPKPCDHFDLIVGTGTGGLIAIMLGRLRLDLETSKEVYVRMTRRVFETDKTIAGIPYRSTLFKASKLEEAIRECVREHTVFEDEGNDSLANAQDVTTPETPATVGTTWTNASGAPKRTMSTTSRTSYNPSMRSPLGAGRWGNPNAKLYDVRENRTKTAVTAVFRNSQKNVPAAMLRSYDSRKEPAIEPEITIWQSGRATSATGLAFKPIQVGQSIFLDEGQGRFNPSPQVLDEATMSEWPGREVGVFVSIGTGKRPNGSDHQKSQWWESYVGGSNIGDFAEAKRRLMAKIEGCEETHQYMIGQHLARRQVEARNYYRLNVEVGVGEFGMNEWNRLSDISTNTRMYLGRQEVQLMNQSASAKLARIHKMKIRFERNKHSRLDSDQNSWQESVFGNDYHTSAPPSAQLAVPPPSNPMAVELPADEGYSGSRPTSQYQPQHAQPSAINTHLPIIAPIQASSDEFPQVVDTSAQLRPLNAPSAYPSQRVSQELPIRSGPPPLPPKTPIPYQDGMPLAGTGLVRPPGVLPYPDTDGPPPPVNMARKPAYGMR